MSDVKHIVIDARNRRSSTGRYTDRLITHLQKIDPTNQYTILVETDDPWKMFAPNFKTLPVHYKQFSFNPLDQFGFAAKLHGLKPDLVHFAMTQQPLFYRGTIVTTTHDLTMLRYTRASRFPGWLHSIGMVLYRVLFLVAHKKSSQIIVPSQYVAKALTAYQPFTKDKITVTYESSEPPIADPPEPLQGVSKPFIFHVGAPFPHKNIDRLIKAFEALKMKHPDLQLVLPGRIKNQFKQDLDNWVTASKFKDSIVVPGFISDAELKWLYENTEAYILPSLSEGFGLPGLEAMSHGCPLVSSNATCLPEIYGDAAEYFDPENILDMTQAIEKVINDTKLKKKLIKAGHLQIQKYSWQTMAEQTLKVYNQALKT